jgi:hypothetical protein
MKSLPLIAAALLCAGPALAAKAPPPPPVLPMDAGPEEYQTRLTTYGDRDRVLNQMEIGARSFWKGDHATSKAALDDAIGQIGRVFANSPDAAKARQLWYDEGSKTFKGEPYERVMVYFYRGLGYLRDGDFENARAAFRQGQMQDAFAEESQNRADFGLLVFLEAWASHQNGDADLRDESLARLKALRPDFPGIGKGDDTLVLLETGAAPRKLGDGLDHSYFVYRRGKNIAVDAAEVVRAGQAQRAYRMEDIYWQASTRGGREVDKILQGKASFKAGTGAVGSALADGVGAYNDIAGASTAGAAVGAVAGVFLIVSSSTKPQADTRYWSSLPDQVHVLTFASKGKPPEMTARFLKGDQPATTPEAAVRCDTFENRKTLCLVRAY